MWNEQWCGDPYAGEGWDSTMSTSADDEVMFEGPWALAMTAVAGIAVYEGFRRVLARGKPKSTGSLSAPVAPPPASPRSAQDDPVAHNAEAVLIDELISLYDVAPSDALRRRIARSLGKAGVRLDDDTGAHFDSARHDVLGTEPATGVKIPGTVIEVVRPGFTSAEGRVLRPSEVVVATDADGAW